MSGDPLLAGVMLLAVVPFVVWDAVSGMRAGFDSAFWALPLDEKMDVIPQQHAAWHRLGIAWIFINALLIAGFSAFSVLLAAEGEPSWAAAGMGVFALTATSFVVAVALMVATVSDAAKARRDSGVTPEWVHPGWRFAWWMERAFVIGANLAYVGWGIGIVASGYPAAWAGWVAIVTGALIALWASLRDFFFQHMVLLTPVVLGIALVLAG